MESAAVQAMLQGLTDQMAAMTAKVTTLESQNQELNSRLLTKDQEVEELRATSQTGRPAEGNERTSLVQKWAPDDFSGKHSDWTDWAVKFRSYMGALLSGRLGQWLVKVEEKRGEDSTVTVLGEASRSAASLLHTALIATCQGTSLTVVRRAGAGEGLEAWRQLLLKYEPRSKQTRVIKLIDVLSFSFKEGALLDRLESFDHAVAEYEKESAKTVDDDTKIGVVIKGLANGSLKEHLLLHSERCDTYSAFRAELDTIARAQASAQLDEQPMDIGAFSRKGAGKAGGFKGAFDGNCLNCGKKGHKKADCFAPGGGAAKSGPKGGSAGGGYKGGGGKAPGGANKPAGPCFKCGMSNHRAADCRSSAEKCKKHRDSKAGGGNRSMRELNDEPQLEGELGGLSLCAVRGEESLEEVRNDSSDRKITFGVDSAACRTVAQTNHPACRGYKRHKDNHYGCRYGTAKNKGPTIEDEGLRILQTKASDGVLPQRLRTRAADVHKPLLAVVDMVDNDHAVLFDKDASYALNKKTGLKTYFTRVARGWDLTLDLEAPDKANKVAANLMAEMRETRHSSMEPEIDLKAFIMTAASDPTRPEMDRSPEERKEALFHWAGR